MGFAKRDKHLRPCEACQFISLSLTDSNRYYCILQLRFEEKKYEMMRIAFAANVSKVNLNFLPDAFSFRFEHSLWESHAHIDILSKNHCNVDMHTNSSFTSSTYIHVDSSFP